ncbi:MAG: acyl-CoA thioesterase [Phycisphaerae bacterium]|nr:acyl-CoA thioesterase [Phycisphaerae bacterium]
MVFEHPLRVKLEDIDEMGHVNNVVYLRYAQDAAAAHWIALASEEQLKSFVWVARRHEIDYLRPAFPDEELLARTWVGEASGATYERFVEIARPRDNETLARVRSVWVLLDAKSHRPRRVTEELRARFGGAEA